MNQRASLMPLSAGLQRWPFPLALVAAGVACGALTVYGAPWLGFLLLAGALFTLLTLRQPSAGIMVILLGLYLLPFGVVPIPVGALRLTFLDATLSIALLALVLRLLAHPGEPLALSPAGAPLLLFLGMATVAFLGGMSTATGETLRLFLKTINSILLYFTVINSLRTPDEVRRITRMAPVAAGGAATLALALYWLPPEQSYDLLASLAWLGYPTGESVLRYIADTPILRASGTAIDPNVLGGMLLLALPLAVTQLVECRTTVPRLLLAACVAINVLALLLSYSRSGWAGALAALVLLGLLRYRRVLLAIAAGAMALLLLPQGQAFVERFVSGLFFADRAAQMRLGEYSDALRLITRYPWFGVGFGGPPDLDLYLAGSSIYFLLAEEAGLVGLGAYLLVLGTVVTYIARRLGRARRVGLAGVQMGALAGVAGALVAGLFDHYFVSSSFTPTIALFWLYAGLAMAAAHLAAGQHEEATSGG